jgi:uncharacterized protein
MSSAPALLETQAWVQRAVIGLNLCPFAKVPHLKGLVRYVLCDATDPAGLVQALVDELTLLARTAPAKLETTLLVHPAVLTDFAEYNDFLDVAEDTVADLGLEGVIQVASFHPQYQFAGAAADDVTNATNQSPYPMLHLIREESIERAVKDPEVADRVVQANTDTLQRLGAAGWAQLQRDCRQDATHPPPPAG